VRQYLGAMVMSDAWDELSNDREGATTVKETVLDSQLVTGSVCFAIHQANLSHDQLCRFRSANHWGGVCANG
jgi:hypothetical protein